MRVNLSVAIVYMSGEKNMDWDESRQGFILGKLDFIKQGWVDNEQRNHDIRTQNFDPKTMKERQTCVIDKVVEAPVLRHIF